MRTDLEQMDFVAGCYLVMYIGFCRCRRRHEWRHVIDPVIAEQARFNWDKIYPDEMLKEPPHICPNCGDPVRGFFRMLKECDR